MSLGIGHNSPERDELKICGAHENLERRPSEVAGRYRTSGEVAAIVRLGHPCGLTCQRSRGLY